MSDFIKLAREPNQSCKIPENIDTPIWRYMDMVKFQSLLTEKAIRLCRADLLQERFEGTYSRHQIEDMDNWFKKIGKSDMTDIEKKNRKIDRLKTYISCWCISDCDLDLMWKAYVGNYPGVAIKSSVRRLINICDNEVDNLPIDISTVTYFDHVEGELINYFGTPTSFLYKDNHFKLDNELRIIHYPNISEPTPTHVLLPIDLNELIESVVLKPKVKDINLQYIIELLRNVGLDKTPVLASRDDRYLIE